MEGDFLSYHSLNPVFDILKVKNGNDSKYFNERLKTITFYLSNSRFIEVDQESMNSANFWTVKQGNGFFEYSSLY